MRIDVVTIFPEYLAPLSLSLPGKAQRRGLLEVHVHDLRTWTHDRHRTVDDTPYGGGAGMVMRPEPWGEALDALAGGPRSAGVSGRGPVVVFPTPAGRPFTQRSAAELAAERHLVFACGRYEGIDQRVVDDAATRARVVELSLGDYVLNGGEVAALAMIESVVRLLPGFMGNEESLAEESHTGTGLLEYPVYTRPPVWRGRGVPEVLLSGDHGRVAAWRREQAQRRTAERRPDLLHPSRVVSAADLSGAAWRLAERGDAGELLTLQRACWATATADHGPCAEVLEETLETVEDALTRWRTFVLRASGRLVASVRGRAEGEDWVVDRLMVAPDLQRRGLGRWLLEAVQDEAPAQTGRVRLEVPPGCEAVLRLCRRAGFRRLPDGGEPRLVTLVRRR